MQARIKVFGHFTSDSRTPLVGEKVLHVNTYSEAWDAAKSFVRELTGKTAHVECDGPNHNYNSRWIVI